MRSFFTAKWTRQVIASILIFSFGGILELFVFCPGCATTSREMILSFIYTGFFWVSLWKGSEFGVVLLDSKLPWIKFPFWRTIASLLWVVILTFFVTKFLDISLDMIFQGMSLQEASATQNVSFLRVLFFNTVMNLLMHGRGFLLAWRQASIDLERLRTEQVFTQFQSLKNQVNPHFLFNTLNALSSLVYEDQDKAVEFIKKLSEVYRYVLDKNDDEVVPIKDEVEFLKNFVFLQKIRFSENLIFQLKGKGEGYLPPLALQLLVENAIKHNVISENHPLTIQVDIGEEFCSVRNNRKEKLTKDSTGIGLHNLKERYKYLSEHPIQINSDEHFFEVKIPILKFKDEVHNHRR